MIFWVRVVWKTKEIQWFREIFICVGVVKVSLEAGVLCFSVNLTRRGQKLSKIKGLQGFLCEGK